MTQRILYMEDDAAQARLVQRCLERAGYTVDVADDGAEGLACYMDHAYDAVIVDQTMPQLSGLEVIRTMSAQGPIPPTIMVTGTGDERIAVETMKLGVSDYLVKDIEGGVVHVLPLVVGRAIQQGRALVEKQQMELELAQAQKMKAIGQLAAGIAHEINTPTQYIADNMRFLQDAFADMGSLLDACERLLHAEEQHNVSDELIEEVKTRLHKADLEYMKSEVPLAIQQSLEGVKHVADIVGAMKEYSHPGDGQKRPVDLNHIIEGAITLCRNEWKYVADVLTDLDGELPPVICLPADVHRLVMNLVVNAAHAIEEASRDAADGKGRITVRTRRDDCWAEIRVEDTGAGIPEEIRDRIFDPFFTTKEVGRGTGQGLSIVHAIVVEKHGGAIRFETEIRKGTAFVVRLPIDGQLDSCQIASEEPAETSEDVVLATER